MICSHLGWTWDYLHHGIAFAIVQRMMADAPGYEDTGRDGSRKETIRITTENAEELAKRINSIAR